MTDSSDYYEYSIEHIEYMQQQRLEDFTAYEMLGKLFEIGLFMNIWLNQITFI